MESGVVGDCVVDASVGIKLFLVEDGSEAADRLFAELVPATTADQPLTRFYVPDLFLWNVAISCGNMCVILAMKPPVRGKM
ncbi:MAG: hypothetical protein M5U34_27265 [Chloroflexi bacterium]|nr:hypothetical protein [Chloroflexota bacterium]